ncbi:hypothetical protein ROZALSC1DRAFT_26379 [Rozella allomycis CSF55]|uniref:Uncharacterized protein n=1 Tax=Rozella allomycis (strain CSF55) TaxID=988480 RepID=A0A4V1IYS1_ROZAC|nr:hypothetical protein ROZALSC1DRAFT_26379 [Rozella allomycis CSF55]
MTLESISSIMNVLQGDVEGEGDDEGEGSEVEGSEESESDSGSESESESEDSNNEVNEVEGESMVANEDIEDEDLSDSEMFQFDQQLANIFSEKKRLKKESKEILFQF